MSQSYDFASVVAGLAKNSILVGKGFKNKEKNNSGKVQKNKFMKNTKKKINPAKEMVMTKRSLKQFKNLKKYKK